MFVFDEFSICSSESFPLDTAGRAAKATGVCRAPQSSCPVFLLQASSPSQVHAFMHVVSSYLFMNITYRVFLPQLAYNLWSMFVFQGIGPLPSFLRSPPDLRMFTRPSAAEQKGNISPCTVSRLRLCLPASTKR